MAALPGLVEHWCRDWDLSLHGPTWNGEVGLILSVTGSTGPAALKISFPHPGNRGEAKALRCFDGRAAVRLLDQDTDGFVLLLERAGPQTLASLPSIEQPIEISGDLARRLAVPAPAGLKTLAESCGGWLDQLDSQFTTDPNALSPRSVDRARSIIGQLAEDRTPTMMHGDLHTANVVSAEREPWLIIDPKRWSGTVAFDAFTVVGADPGLRTGAPPTPQVLRGWVDRFAAAAGVDAELARACTQARAVSSYLHQVRQPEDWFALELLRTLAETIS